MSLCPAVASGDVEQVRDLLARGADPNQLGSYKGQCAIEWAMAMVKIKKRTVGRTTTLYETSSLASNFVSSPAPSPTVPRPTLGIILQ